MNVRGSLTRRIVFIVLAVLVVPLCLHSLFLYYQEYLQSERGVMQTLVLFGEGRVARIKDAIEAQWLAIDGCPAESLPCSRVFQVRKGIPPQGISAGTEPFAWVDTLTSLLFVGKGLGNEAVWIETDLHRWMQSLPLQAYPIDLSFIDEEGEIFASTKDQFMTHLSLPKGQNWLLNLGSEKVLAFHLDIPHLSVRLLLTVPAEAVAGLRLRNYAIRMGGFFVFFAALSGGSALLLTRRFARPMEALSLVMRHVSEGRLEVRYRPDRLGFELNRLGAQFNATVEALVQQQKVAEEARIEREKLAEELRIGQAIQKNMLPEALPTVPSIEMAAGYLPALEVSGDFYDCIFLQGGSLLLAMADVSGKGIPACLYALDVRGVLRGVATSVDDISELVHRVNRLLILDTKDSGMFATLWIAVYDPTTRCLHYCSQGHPPALLKRNGVIEELETRGLALGIQEAISLTTKTVILEPGDSLVLYTDGVIEAIDVQGQLFRKERLQQALLKSLGSSAQKMVEEILEEIRLFSKDTPQADDISLLVMRVV